MLYVIEQAGPDDGWTQSRIAEAKGVDQSIVSRRIRLSMLPESVLYFMTKDTMNEGKARELLDLCNCHNPESAMLHVIEQAGPDDGWTQSRIAEAKGVDRTTVSFRLRFSEFPDSISHFVTNGFLNEGKARELLDLLHCNNPEPAMIHVIEQAGPAATAYLFTRSDRSHASQSTASALSVFASWTYRGFVLKVWASWTRVFSPDPCGILSTRVLLFFSTHAPASSICLSLFSASNRSTNAVASTANTARCPLLRLRRASRYPARPARSHASQSTASDWTISRL